MKFLKNKQLPAKSGLHKMLWSEDPKRPICCIFALDKRPAAEHNTSAAPQEATS